MAEAAWDARAHLQRAEDLIDAVDNATRKRAFNPAVRVEVEHEMPEFVRDLLLSNLRREESPDAVSLDGSDIHEMTGLVDLRSLTELELPESPGLTYANFNANEPKFQGSILDTIREVDLMYHHPFDSFDATVVKFLRDAADDPAVTNIKITLYRIGNSSGVAETLIDAARKGKRMAVDAAGTCRLGATAASDRRCRRMRRDGAATA